MKYIREHNFKQTATASLISITSFVFFSHASFAQNAIAPDNTLPVNTSVNFNSTNKTYTITGGTQAGGNQFHSFQDFSVPTGNTAHFDTAPTTFNAIGRVTGSNVSNIDGILRTNGTTNLYLVNPNGIVFGANAKLNIAGSFSASTANSIKFSDGSEFSATNPQAPPLLNVNVPLGLQYGNSNGGATISNRGNLSAGQDLVLNADKLDLQGTLQAGRDLTLQAQDLVKIRDTSTSPFFAISGRDLLIQGNQSVDIFTLNHRNSGFWSGGNMLLRSQNPVIGDAHFYAGNNLKIEKLDGSLGNLISPNDPVILANGDVDLGDYTGASLHILAGGSVTLGNVTIDSTGDVATTINPSNTTLFNATKTYADLAPFNLTDYQAVLNSDGSVKEIVPVQVPITINGSTQATLDVRSGVDWLQLGGLPTSPTFLGATAANYVDPPTRADIIVNGNIRISQSGGLVLLTNQFSSSTSQGTIAIQGIDTSTDIAQTNAGDIRIYGRGDIKLNSEFNAYSNPTSGNAGNGAAISISSDSGNITMTSAIYVDSYTPSGNTGNGGAISFSSNSGNITLDFLYFEASSFARSGNTANAGAISLTSNSGNITLNSPRLKSTSVSQALGNSGNGGTVSFATYSGDITIKNARGAYLDSGTYSKDGYSGNGGAFSLASHSGNITLINSPLNSSTASYSLSGSDYAGNGGRISLVTSGGNITLNDLTLYSYSFAESTNSQNGGTISLYSGSGNISLNNLTLSAYSFASSASSQNGGAISIAATNGNIISTLTSYLLSFSISAAGLKSGNGGEINLTAKNQIRNLALFTPSSFGQAGAVNINGLGDLTIANLQIITSKTVQFPERSYDANDPNTFITTIFESGKNGRSGDVMIMGLGNLTFDNSIINSTTQGRDPAGNISITSAGLMVLQTNTQILSSTTNIGNAGNIRLITGDLILTDRVLISASTAGSGKAGDISISANNFTLSNGAKLQTTTSGVGNSGTIKVNVANNITLQGNGTGLFADTAIGSSGNGGNINIDPQFVLLKDGAKIAVGSLGSGIGGNITLISNYLSLLDGSSITAETASTNGGNITLNIPSILLLRYGSQISTTAGTSLSGGNGGNINITAGFIVGLPNENSDIFANAFTGNGGKVNITTNGIFGLAFRPKLTSLSDITASSQFGIQGNVSLNTLGVDPSKGLNNLPADLGDASKLVTQKCLADRQDSAFMITGRGGIPASPADVISGNKLQENLGIPTNQLANQVNQLISQPNHNPDRIVEAQGWKINQSGEVSLVAEVPKATPAPTWARQLQCR